MLVSRSSLQLVQIERVELLTLAQAANAALWTLQAYFKAVSSLPLLFAGMVFVGLLGGASYVNVFHLLLKDPKIPEADRELCALTLAALLTALPANGRADGAC